MVEVRIALHDAAELALVYALQLELEARRKAWADKQRGRYARSAELFAEAEVIDAEVTDAPADAPAAPAYVGTSDAKATFDAAQTELPLAAKVSGADLEAAVRKYIETHNLAAARAVLTEFGIDRISECPADKQAALLARLAV